MTKISKPQIIETNDSETIIENEIVVTTTKLVKNKIVDMSGGKIQLITEGYADGEKVRVTVNGNTEELEIFENFGIFCSGNSFMQYPVIIIND